MKKKQKQRNCKPGYVGHPWCGDGLKQSIGRRPTGAGPSFICDGCCQTSIAVYPPAMGEQPLNAGILDLATHKTCGTEYRYP
ncbi:hypothetical protein, partial [Bacteroides heparinolyticus]|uniref:hypothetical protein n=1 Tax=Prevotella heparinolytica TaxID=28113 RepID=UPI003AF1C961